MQTKYRTRIYYPDVQKALMWERWRQGWTLHQIAQLLDRAHGSVRRTLSGPEAFKHCDAAAPASRDNVMRRLERAERGSAGVVPTEREQGVSRKGGC